MNLSAKFRRFAAECEAMSKCAKSSESKASWDGMAARWLLFAELADDRYSPKADMAQPRRRRSRYHCLN
jgi:hypothetical protein